MNTQNLSICIAFFWLGFSLTFILFTLFFVLKKSKQNNAENAGENTGLSLSEDAIKRFLFMILIFSGVWGAISLLSELNALHKYINQSYIIGIIFGVFASNRLIGLPSFKK